MGVVRFIAAFIVASLFAGATYAKTEDFSGTWYIDLRSKVERQEQKDCGGAYFALTQVGDSITGNHTFATVGCGHLNEGGENSVKGIAVGSTAVLVVTSGRNGAIVMGKAVKRHHLLYWTTLDEIAPGQGEGDSPLILDKGVLHLEKPTRKSN